MDQNKLRTLVFEKTGIRIDVGDPVFALVALNEAVLSECVEAHADSMASATAALRSDTAQLLVAAEELKRQLQASGAPVSHAGALAGTVRQPRKWQWIAAAGGMALCSALLTLAGLAATGHWPATTVQGSAASVAPVAPALTPEQAVLIQNGEKYARMWPRLDAKTQARIQEALRQP
jgi:hypothetical protein